MVMDPGEAPNQSAAVYGHLLQHIQSWHVCLHCVCACVYVCMCVHFVCATD
jgi:hypothetical protein